MTYLGDEWAQGYVLDGIDYAPLVTIRQILDHTDGFQNMRLTPFYLLASSRLDVLLTPKKSLTGDLNEDRYSFRNRIFLQYGRPCYCRTRHRISNREQAHELLREYITIPANAPDVLPPKEFPEMVPAMFVQGELAALIALPLAAPYLEMQESLMKS